MKIAIRNMISEDIPSILALEQELFSDAWTERSLTNTLYYRPDTSLIAQVDGQTVGYLFFMAAADEGELLRIGVAPGMQGKGIATALIGSMDHYVLENGIFSVWLEVRESNQAALSLYRETGFTEQGSRRHYYHKPDEDAMIMCKRYPDLS